MRAGLLVLELLNSPADNPSRRRQPPSGPHSRSSRPCSSPPSPSLFSPSTTLLVSSGRADDFARSRIERNAPQEATRLVSRAVFSDFVLYVQVQVAFDDVSLTPDCPVSLSSLPARYALCLIFPDNSSQAPPDASRSSLAVVGRSERALGSRDHFQCDPGLAHRDAARVRRSFTRRGFRLRCGR